MLKKVYVEMTADFIHHGHINILNEAAKHGSVIVGLLSDEAVANLKRMPLLSYENRKVILEQFKNIDEIVLQQSIECLENIEKIRPDVVIHGTDWQQGGLVSLRDKVIEVLKGWNGKLVEVEFTKGVSATELIKKLKEAGVTPNQRLKKLRELIAVKPAVRVMEAHNGLSGLIVEEAKHVEGDQVKEFDALWVSSLTDSISKGKPDNGIVDFSSRMQTIEQLMEITTKPIIVDGDNGGFTEHFSFFVKSLERHAVSAVIIEDKIGLKKNSLFGTEVEQTQESIENFCEKISAGKKAQLTEEFMVIARIESLILEQGMEDAIARAKAYIGAGADGIMIHSKQKTPDEIVEFCRQYGQFENKVPLVVVPTTYNSITEEALVEHGVSVVIYANHLLRSAYPAMLNTAQEILKNGRSQEVEGQCMKISDILTLIPGGK